MLQELQPKVGFSFIKPKNYNLQNTKFLVSFKGIVNTYVLEYSFAVFKIMHTYVDFVFFLYFKK